MSDDASAASPSASPRPSRGHVLAGWKIAVARLAGLLVRLWCRTLRITLDDTSRALLAPERGPSLFVLWHNRLFPAANISLRFRPGSRIHCLISTSKDGAWLSSFFESVGLRAVRGSSSKGGREAVGELIAALRSGQDVGITPDGPRGPIYVCKPGAVVIARRAGVRVILIGVTCESVWSLRSWDRFQLPRPFSRVRLRLREFSLAELEGDDAHARLQSALRELNPDA